ncbi:hypothetical protein ACKC9G_12490 [Pokkaliibacter sp. CJK22405]|uniref:hypothetical protein n=1 Tax=Pokkaliibacter sp. CJK22405 TaxID=3384615 RepID=UPI0039852053
MPTLRGVMDTYAVYGNSEGPRRDIKATKTADYREVNQVTDATMVKLKISSKVGKTIDKLCDKGNQLDDVYATRGESSFRRGVIRNYDVPRNEDSDDDESLHYADMDMLDHKIMAGNCGEMGDFAESIVAAVNQDRVANGLPHIPAVYAEWPGDHHFMVLGDPREKPANECVTVDGWVMRPSAHTLDNSAFQSGTTYGSSTRQVSEDYLDKQFSKRSLNSIEREVLGDTLTNSQRREFYYDKAKEQIRNHEFKLWDHQYADANADVVQYYRSPRQEDINFDYLPRAEKNRKSDEHADARRSGLQRAVTGQPGMRDVAVGLAGLVAGMVLDRR